VGLVAQSPDLSRPGADGKGRRPEGPVALAGRGVYDPSADRLALEVLNLATRYGVIDAAGRVDETAGRRLADLKGTLAPNWKALSALAAASIESGATLDGRPRPYHVRGPLSGGSLAALLKGLDADLGLDLTSANAFGLALGPAPLVLRCKGGVVTLDPVETTLNGGKVLLNPDLDVDETRGIALKLRSGSSIQGAEINDEVSRRVLSYVAPVLNEATHVQGKVNVAVEQADFPITGPPDRTVTLTGQVVFQGVTFAPGPFANQLLTLTGRPDSPGLQLAQPVQLSIANRRVYQKGLEVPVRKDAKIALEGSVGFDETLNLVASVPITGRMLGARSEALDRAINGQTVKVPIGGTVGKPRVDRRALQVALKELSRSVLSRELSQEASKLLDRLGPPPAAGEGAGNRRLPTDTKVLEDAVRQLLPRRGNRTPRNGPNP
jgi:translocation and assembly module TamB